MKKPNELNENVFHGRSMCYAISRTLAASVEAIPLAAGFSNVKHTRTRAEACFIYKYTPRAAANKVETLKCTYQLYFESNFFYQLNQLSMVWHDCSFNDI